MTTTNEAPQPSTSDIEFEELWVYWVEAYALTLWQARLLALYQYTGGNAYGLINLSGEVVYAPRGIC